MKCHFSVDDVLDSFLAASAAGGDPGDQPFLAFLDLLHAKFPIPVHLHLFERKTGGAPKESLAALSPDVAQWILARDWIRLGPHAQDADTPLFQQSLDDQCKTVQRIYSAMDRLVRRDRFSSWVRLHFFAEAFELARVFSSYGVEALLTTDKPAIAYRLPEDRKQVLGSVGRVHYRGIDFIRSDLRIESLTGDSDEEVFARLKAIESRTSCPVIFTHEYELMKPEVQEMTLRLLSLLHSTQTSRMPFEEAKWASP